MPKINLFHEINESCGFCMAYATFYINDNESSLVLMYYKVSFGKIHYGQCKKEKGTAQTVNKR